MSSDKSKVLIWATAAVLILPQLISPFLRSDEEFAATENRNITPFPRKVKWRTIAGQLEAYYQDRIPFRRWMMPLSRRVQSALFPRHSELAIVGKDGFLFITMPGKKECPFLQYTGKYPEPVTHHDRKKTLDYLRKAQDHAERNHAQFLMVVMPNKIDIYPDMLPEKRAFRQGGFLAEELAAAAHAAEPEIHFLYLKPALLDYRKKMSCPLYFAQDTHWNFAGAYCGTKAVIDRLGLPWPTSWSLPENAPLETAENRLNHNDLLARAPAGTPFRKEPDYGIAVPREGIRSTKIGDGYFITENPAAFDQREVLVFRDSFFNAMWLYFAAYFRKVHFHHGEYDAAVVEKIGPQLVIYSRVARVLPYFYRKKIR